MAVHLSFVTLRSRDPDRTTSFYRQIGLMFAEHQHGGGPRHYAAETAGVTFEIYPLRPGDTPTVSTRLGFRVAALTETIARLVDAGGEVLQPAASSPWGTRAIVRDPDGHKVELYDAGASSS